jgi:hypothetical protein
MSSSRKLDFDASSSSVYTGKTGAVEDIEAEKSKIVMVDNYREPVELPPFLNVKKNSWEIIVNEYHIQPNHKLVSDIYITLLTILYCINIIILFKICSVSLVILLMKVF